MSWHKQEQCWTKVLWPKMRAVIVKQEREAVYVALQDAASFHCLVEERKDCEETQGPSRKKSGVLLTRGERE